MAKLISALKFRGTVDDLCFRLTEDGVVVQKKPGPTPEQVRTGNTFDLTRRNASEFGRATKDAMLLRRALSTDIRLALRHSKLNSHMNKRVHRVAMSDKKSSYGSRHMDAGNLKLLEGFDYNHLLSLDTALPVQLEHTMDVAKGSIRIAVPACIVRRKKAFPKGATHFRIVSCASAVDFQDQHYSSTIAQSELLPLSRKMPALELEHALEVQPGWVMLHSVGIVFYKMKDGEAEVLRGGALKIVQVVKKEKVVTAPGAGTPALGVVPPTCANTQQTDQPVTDISAGKSLHERAKNPQKTHKRTRLRGYYTNERKRCNSSHLTF